MSDNGDQDKLLRLLVAKFVKSDKTAHGTAQKLTQLTFWREMRQVLAANEASTGLEALDDIAEAILDETGEAEDVFSGPILLLPKPSRMRESKGAPNHQRFTSYLPESPKSTPSGPKNPPKANPKSLSKVSKKRKSPSPSRAVNFFMDALAVKTPQIIRDDLERLYRRASELGAAPYELAYPWAGSRLFYDPALYPHVHVAHWRMWQNHRPISFDCQLHAPIAGKSAQDRRQKKKMDAVEARLGFTSLCVETWGYYGYLQRLEDVRDERLLMWWGGQPGKNQSQGEDYHGPVIESLSVLRWRDPIAYAHKMKNALKPFSLDKGRFTRMTDLLLLTGALNVDAKPERRLSDRALARILHDINSKRDPRPHWVGDLTTGEWLNLRNCERIQKEEAKISKALRDDKYEFPTVASFDPKEANASGFTPIVSNHRSYTAIWKSGTADDEEEEEKVDGSGSEEDDSEEDKPPPPKKPKPSRSSSDSSGDDTTTL
ncbi:hypothetical protein PR003_g10179 [Phytophthora rubi]|uniref:Uncharacterized protein n=1 Tax=Phytophthora rubi TaxID=129364 RepID=A0A6A4FE81_9STRA|nr:hypothetical protein PR001_g9797 [Phytophthora rubi]KAE9341041.1 hypothetical protein PR003_g10179 [Phytophthora rubi]